MKKILFLFLVFSLVLSSLSFVFAADSHIADQVDGGLTNHVFGANQYSSSIIYSKGRYWYIGVEETTWDIWIYNSTDGVNWNGSELDSNDLYHGFGTWTYNNLHAAIDDDENIHVAWYKHDFNIFYKKIYPLSNGSITTNATQDILTGSVLFDLIIDGAGYPVIFADPGDGGRLMGSSTNNGSWTTDYNVIVEGGRQVMGQIAPVCITSNRDIMIVYQWDTGGYGEYYVKSYRYAGGLGARFALDAQQDLIGITGEDYTYWANLLDVIYDAEYTFVLCNVNKTGYGKCLTIYEIHSQNDGTIIVDDWAVLYNGTGTEDYLGYGMRLDVNDNLIIYYKHDNINNGNETYFYNVLSNGGDVDTDWWFGQTDKELFNVNNTFRPDGFREGAGDWSVTQSGLDFDDIRIVFAKEDHDASGQDCVHINFGSLGMSAPASHLNTTLYNQNGNVNDEWIFEGEVYDLVSYIQNATRFYINTTDSRHQIRFHWNNETEQMWISVDPADQFTIGLPWSNFTRYEDNITRLQWRFIPDRSIIDAQDEDWGYYIENSDTGFNATGFLGFDTNIYNLGGFTYYDFQGDGGRTAGGHPWELYATNGTEGSSARAEQIYRKLQHIHFLIEIDMDNEWDSQGGEFDFTPGVGFVDIGIDYRLNGTWVEGFWVRLYVQSADVGNHGGGNDMNWIEWSVDFWNYDPATGGTTSYDNLLYSNYWGYENENLDPDYHNRTSAQLWVDLWFDRTNASTTVSGQINSMYYGMKEHGSAWWFGYGVFQPMKGEYENAMFLDDLYDEGGNVTDSLKFDLMRVFVEVEKIASLAGDDETWLIRAVENLNHKLADDRMQGVEQPSFEETLVLEMPMFQSMNPLVRAIDGIASAVWKGALGFQKILWSAMDSFFAWAGFGTGFFSRITAFLGAIPELFLKMMESIPIMIQNMVELVDDIFGMVVRILPEFVLGIGYLTDSVMNYWTTLTAFFTGGIFPINIIQDLQIGDWLRAGFAMLPAWEMFSIIWAEDSGKKAKERIDFYSMLFNGVINFVKGAISFMQSFIQTIMDILPG